MTMMMYGYTNAPWSVDFFVFGCIAGLQERYSVQGRLAIYVRRDWASGTTTDDLFIYHVGFSVYCLALNDINS